MPSGGGAAIQTSKFEVANWKMEVQSKERTFHDSHGLRVRQMPKCSGRTERCRPDLFKPVVPFKTDGDRGD